jgi:hypothetical protein
MISILPDVVDFIIVSDLIKVAARIPAIAAAKIRAMIRATIIHLHL